MPELKFEYFDPETQKIERVSCEKPPVLSRSDEFRPPTHPTSSDPGVPDLGWRAQAVAAGFAAIGLAMVITAMRR